MKLIKALLYSLSSVVFLTACDTEEKTYEKYYLLTQLGADTLAVEKIEIMNDSISAEVLLRSPKLRKLSYGFTLNPTAKTLLRGLANDGVSKELISTNMAEWVEDSLHISINAGDRQKNIMADRTILPFIDMVHWPFDIMLKRANTLVIGDTLVQPLFSGTRSFDFKVVRIGADSMTVKHPSRGVMGVTVGSAGELLLLDAGQTTRKLTVTRLSELNFEGLEASFMAAEKSGKSFGALSGRGKTEKEVGGVNYLIDYGTPAKRDRDIWGSLVKYGERWRTGANRATHFKTDKDIMLGDLNVPAGEYTFFSIPAEESLTLMVNTQTGQNGRTYDAARDLGSVELKARELPEVVEIFTIDIIERDGQEFLSLMWDRKAYEVEIR